MRGKSNRTGVMLVKLNRAAQCGRTSEPEEEKQPDREAKDARTREAGRLST